MHVRECACTVHVWSSEDNFAVGTSTTWAPGIGRSSDMIESHLASALRHFLPAFLPLQLLYFFAHCSLAPRPLLRTQQGSKMQACELPIPHALPLPTGRASSSSRSGPGPWFRPEGEGRSSSGCSGWAGGSQCSSGCGGRRSPSRACSHWSQPPAGPSHALA